MFVNCYILVNSLYFVVKFKFMFGYGMYSARNEQSNVHILLLQLGFCS